MPTLYLIRGVSGAGKSSLARELKSLGLVTDVLEADNYMFEHGQYKFKPEKLQRAHSLCQSEAQYWLELGESIAVSNTSTTEKEVEVYRKIAEECGAIFVSLIVENRSGTKSVHDVPDETLEKQRKRFSVKL